MNRRRNKPIDTPFVPHRIEMLESPAYRALSRGGHRVLARLEIELAGLKRILKKLKTDAGPEFDVA